MSGPSPESQALSPSIAIVGPTGSGKSELALRLAERFGGAIVNFDSVQVYRHFDIGTAKIPPDQRRGIAHHLLDHVDPSQSYSAGEFARDARRILETLRGGDMLPVLVGGTGLYLEALLKGLFRQPDADPRLRDRLRGTAERHPPGYLWRILCRLDRQAAASVHRNDTPKVIRAIEVSLSGGRPITEQWRDSREPLRGFRVLVLGLEPPREDLYARIEKRTARMFAEGLVEEVQGLLERGVPRSARPFGALGYAQCLRYLDGECSRREAIESTAQGTRRYAKRQLTWFRHRLPDVHWVEAFGDSEEAGMWALREYDEWM